jgi:hypothetical protein
MQYAFINQDGIVVQVIAGVLNAAQQAQFLRDYAILFRAIAIVEVDASTPIWIGGAYTDGKFLPPEVVEGTSEELLSPEVPSDSIPG